MKNKITWLHLSDIHFNANSEWRDSITRDSFIQYLDVLIKDNPELKPDLIFCTGDIAFGEIKASSLSEQYQQAKDFFDKLLKSCGLDAPLPKERLFVVPGNHDVNRQRINQLLQNGLLDSVKDKSDSYYISSKFETSNNSDLKDVLVRLNEYGEFVESYLPHQHTDDDRYCFSKTLEVNGVTIGVGGLNSAWSCSGEMDDRSVLLAARWQLNKITTNLRNADIKIGLIHHPVDWLHSSERIEASQRFEQEFDFMLHGHIHNAWINPGIGHVKIASGAVGAETTEEFGFNITTVDYGSNKVISYLHTKDSKQAGWTIKPISGLAPKGEYIYTIPNRVKPVKHSVEASFGIESFKVSQLNDLLQRIFEDALKLYPSVKPFWIDRTLRDASELSGYANADTEDVCLTELIDSPRNVFIKAPPQYGLTSLAHKIIQLSWSKNLSYGMYLDCDNLKPNKASILENVEKRLVQHFKTIPDIKYIVLDSFSESDRNHDKIIDRVIDQFPELPVLVMERMDNTAYIEGHTKKIRESFLSYYLWSLNRKQIRELAAGYIASSQLVLDENTLVTRLVSDLDTLNLPRTPLNCLTLLKVSELDFEESPINRSEIIKRILFLLFNVDLIPTYKAKPDLKDCEYVLGYFCEVIIREGVQKFTRDKFLKEVNKCCADRLIDLETGLLFDVLFDNNIIIKRDEGQFQFKFMYWIFYFGAQRMHHSSEFTNYIFDNLRYAQYPELIEFYTGIDRAKRDAVEVLINDLENSIQSLKKKMSLPESLNPFDSFQWKATDESKNVMQAIIADGVKDSNLPADIKDKYLDKNYDFSKPYNQTMSGFLTEYSFLATMQLIKSGARALRNSDYVDPELKRKLLATIMNCWNEVSKVLFVIAPLLAQEGKATYDGATFIVSDDFGDEPQERFFRILMEIPSNVTRWFQQDLYSRKMGPLLLDQLKQNSLTRVSKHELILLIAENKPKNWVKYVYQYIVENNYNSFYLFDLFATLRHDYRYGYLSKVDLKEIEHLIKMAATKHVTKNKEPSEKVINQTFKAQSPLPERKVTE